MTPAKSIANSRQLRHLSLVLILPLLWPFSALALDVESVRLWRAPDNTRVVFDLDRPGGYKAFMMADNRRFVIDFDDRSNFKASTDLPYDDTPLKEIRHAVQPNQRLRIVLDLKEDVEIDDFPLAALGDKKDRLVVDLYNKSRKPSESVVIREPNPEDRRDVVIVIDAGHGGEDPGSIGPSNVYEKHVALEISKRLQKLIEKQPGFRVEMTRTGDYGLDLDQRRKIARQKRADLFVSIHADAFKKRDVRGASVYAWNKDGNMSKNEIDLYLQQREKESDLIGGFGGDISIKDRDVIVAQTLMDLSITYSLSSSLEAGADILKEMGKVTRLHGNSAVRQAQFVVLRTPDVPSLLVETGFISNPTDERLLNSAKYQQDMAQSIFIGVTNYFSRTPPEGSYLAWVKNSGRGAGEHVISRGESLSTIANRYKVSVAELMSLNGLSSDNIRAGQTLKVPAI